MKKIVVLDGYALNPGDWSWAALEELGRCVVYDRTGSDEVLERSAGAQVLLTNKTPLGADVMESLESLEYIGVLATGYNVVDVEAAGRAGVVVTNVPAYGTESVAQMVFSHLLNLAGRVGHHSQTVRQGRWSACPDFCYWDTPLMELAGLTMGIIGLGRIGRATARVAEAFQMEVVAYDISSERDGRYRFVELDELFGCSDVVSLHCPLTEETAGIVNAERLAMMKAGAFLINTSRGPLVDEEALAEALNGGVIAGAGLDVLSNEPPDGDNPLLTAKNCSITPHIAWATRAARGILLDVAVDNVAGFIAGQRRNVVS